MDEYMNEQGFFVTK